MLKSLVSVNVNWQYGSYKRFTAYWESYYFEHNVAIFCVALFIIFVWVCVKRLLGFAIYNTKIF